MSDAEGRRASQLEEEKAALEAELDELRARDDAARRGRRRRIRRLTAGVLVVLTSLSVIAATVGVWTRATLFDTDRYVALVSDLSREPEVQEVLADYLTAQAFEALDVENRVAAALASSEALAERADLLAPAIAQGLRTLIHDQVERFLRSEVFQDLWRRLLTVGHQKVVALLRGNLEELPNVVIEEGEVTLNLLPPLAEVIRQVVERGVAAVAPDVTVPTISAEELPDAARARLSAALGNPLPEDFGEVTIMSEQRLSELQDAVRTFDRLIWALVALAVVLFGAALAVSVSRRRTLIQVGIGVAAGLFIGAIAIRRIQEEILAGITNPEGRQAARAVFAATLEDLRSIGSFALWAAVALAIVAYLAGRPRWVSATAHRLRGASGRGLPGWAARHADAVRLVTLAVAAVILFLTGIAWVPVILVGLAVAAVFGALAGLGDTAPVRDAGTGPPGTS